MRRDSTWNKNCNEFRSGSNPDDGIDVMVAQTILAEVGLDMGGWKQKITSFPG